VAAAVALSRLLLGGTLLIAGLQKVGNSLEFSQILANYDLLPSHLEMLAARVIPRLEVAVGLCLVSGIFVRAACTFSVLLTTGFGLFVLSALARGLNVECGCFSGAGEVSWVHLGLDGLLLFLALTPLILGPGRWELDRWVSAKAVGPQKWPITLAALLLVAVCSWATIQVATVAQDSPRTSSSAAPPLVFDPPLLDLGSIPAGKTVEHMVTYRNAGSQPLEIVWVSSTCRCTVPQPGKRRLAPGESGELRVQYHANPSRRGLQQRIKIFQKGNMKPAILQVNAEVTDG
jgi:uncharacterized membrane protein YphA (DoxX/SURF4 family)